MQLTNENVINIATDCMPEQQSDQITMGQGIIMDIAYLNDKLEKHKKDIQSMLKQLPSQFMLKEGGGWSFLNACLNKDGIQWTGDHSTIELLITLGNAIQCVEFQFPKTMWHVLPGGVPYFAVKKLD
jgi:hypothetical protein